MHTIRSICFWGTIVIFGFLSSSTLAKASAQYPSLSENKSHSKNYEIVKLIDGPIDALYKINSTGQTIAQSSDDFWKINAIGEVIDYISSDHLYTSGLIFEKNGFIDWVFTGDKQKKPYKETIDASEYSEHQLFEAFRQADIVEFSEDGNKGRAYLYRQGQAWVLDITPQRDRIDAFYHRNRIKKEYNLRRLETDINANRFKGFSKRKEQLAFVAPQSLDTLPEILTPENFRKEKFHKESSILGNVLENVASLIYSGTGFSSLGYKVGFTEFDLRHQDEIIKFSIFTGSDSNPQNSNNVSWLDPDPQDSGDLKFMAVNYRRYNLVELNENKLLRYYGKDVGLYVVRKKTPHNVITSAAWQLTYDGLHSYKPILGQLNFSEPELHSAYYWLYQPRPDPSEAMHRRYFWPGRRAHIATPVLRAIPSAITFLWVPPNSNRYFRLAVNSSDAWFFDKEETKIELMLELDRDELKQAFQQFNESPHAIQLNLLMEENPLGADLTLHLKSGKRKIRLKKTQLRYQSTPYTAKSPGVTTHKSQTDLFSAYERSLINMNPDAFLSALKILEDKSELADNAPLAIYYFSQLSYYFNINKKFNENLTLFNHYFGIHSLITDNLTDDLQRSNLTVLASQGLYLGSTTHNSTLAESTIKTFVEEGFHLEQETNRVFLFNLACYYSLNHNKLQMLKIIDRAMVLGKNPQSFMNDNDFQNYWTDPDFLKSVNKTNEYTQ